jgi:prepilin-type N-terminal cleavage/methylation domain-containing protein
MKLRNAGFTMVELLMAIAVVGIISVVILPQYIDYRTDAKVAMARDKLLEIREALSGNSNLVANGKFMKRGFILDVGVVPGDLNALVSQGSYSSRNSFTGRGWNGAYLKGNITNDTNWKLDPWGNPIFWNAATRTLTICGPDLQCFAPHDADDIVVGASGVSRTLDTEASGGGGGSSSSSGGAAACASGANDCPGGGCSQSYSYGGGSRECSGGGCTQSLDNWAGTVCCQGGNCTQTGSHSALSLSCDGVVGGCTQTCDGSSCGPMSCAHGYCNQTCQNSAACGPMTCAGGHCNQTCTSGSACGPRTCSGGSCTCTGSAAFCS